MPGETFQTLKAKAKKHATQSGMSQSAAENYGSAMATQSAVQGGANTTGEFLGSNENQINNTVQEIMSNVGGQGGTPNFTDTASQAATQNVQNQIAARKEAEKKMQEAGGVWNPTLGGGQVIYPEKTGIFGNLLPTIMNQGDHVSDPNALNKKTWLKANPNLKGQHKLRTQYDRLLAKYGPAWAKTVQAKSLANYLSGVAVERGGGLGAHDKTYGGGPTENIDPELEKQRQALLAKISGMGTPYGVKI
jgi:hypothetical protein